VCPGYYPPVAPTTVVLQAPAAPAAAAAQSMLYYRHNPKGYYRYVNPAARDEEEPLTEAIVPYAGE